MILRTLFVTLALGVSLTASEIVFYVTPSPAKEGGADGSREKPYSFTQALAVSGTNRATLLLLSGTYTERVEVPALSDAGPLRIAAAPEARVVFEGGSPVTGWEASGALFSFPVADVRPAYSSDRDWLDVWEESTRIRYRIQADEAGVRAYPHSAAWIAPDRVVARLGAGATPDSAKLWRNREGNGLDIQRAHVTVEGLFFRNYNGSRQARAVTVRGANATLRRLEIENCVRGIVVSAPDARVEACVLRGVGQGITGTSVNLTVRDCVIEAATGPFAYTFLNPLLRNGIRFYHPAEGGTVERCVTRGFWAGLFIKTSPPLDLTEAKTFEIRQNTFLDGIRWGGGQSLARYRHNVIGPDEEGTNPVAALSEQGAVLEGNYFFNGRPGNEKNPAGPDPFRALGAGDLRLHDGVKLPEGAGSGVTAVQWLAPETEASPAAETGSRITDISSASSRLGAVVIAHLSRTGSGVLEYRTKGESRWRSVRGVPRTDPNPALMFALTSGELEPETEYEYRVVLGNTSDASIRTFATAGAPKVITVQPQEGALQRALDQALPGDTVRLAPGVYTGAATLAHGGHKEARITVEGSGPESTVVDGGRETDTLLFLRGAPHVTVRGIGFRWFHKAGISVLDGEAVEITDCRFQNSPLTGSTTSGFGILLRNAPGAVITRNLFIRLQYGLMATDSPGLLIQNNTAFLNLYAGIYLSSSSRGSTIKENSLTFTGNASMRIVEPDAEAFATLVGDFNNYAATIAEIGEIARRAYHAAGINPEISGPRLEMSSHYKLGIRAQSKRVINAQVGDGPAGRYFSLDDWQKTSGKDAHSLFADPLYADPARGDFTLLSNSPNLLPDGRVIGALPAQTK